MIKQITLAGTIAFGMLPLNAGELEYGANAHLDELFATLQDVDSGKTVVSEREITRIFRQSGSDAMDMLLARGLAALELGESQDAVWHFSALIDHAPDFAEGYSGRATAFYDLGEYGLAMDDLRMAVALNSRDFNALAGVGIIAEQLKKPQAALDAYLLVRSLNPGFDGIDDAIERVENILGATH